VPIVLVGFSHVFVHDDESYVDAGGPTPLRGMDHCTQEIFDKPRVAAELRRFASVAPVPAEDGAEEQQGWSNALVSQALDGEKPAAVDPEPQEPQPLGAPDVQPQTAEAHGDGPEVPGQRLQKGATGDGESTLGGSEEAVASHSDAGAGDTRWPSRALEQWVQEGRASGGEDPAALAWLDTTAKSLQRALRGYDMTAELLGTRLTPNAALLRLRGTDELTVPKVERRRQELLTSHAIDVINVLAAPMEVIIMVRRPERAILRLQDLWRQRELPDTVPEESTSLLLGARESDGELLYLNVGDGFAGYQPHGPHTLIAGETGSGKGVLVQCLLLDICATNSPRSARIRMIDPKAGIDFPWLRHMPHLD